MTNEAMKAEDQAPDYRKAMLYHSDRADALMAERDDAMALFHAADKQRQALQAERDRFWQANLRLISERDKLQSELKAVLEREAASTARWETKIEAAEAALERDRSFVAEAINAVHSEIAGREWLLEGRGCYEWDDDRYRGEFAQALEAIRGPIDKLRAIARDWSNCPTDPAKIQAARALTPPADLGKEVADE